MAQTVASMVRTGAATALALAAAAVVTAQGLTVRIEDAWVVEGRNGPVTTVAVKVTSSDIAPSLIRLPWRTINGSARATDGDFTGAANTVDIAPGSSEGTLYVDVLDDLLVDIDPTLQMDEAFFVELDDPIIGSATVAKRRATVTIVDNDQSLPGLQYVSAVADGPGGVGRVRLQWRVPASTSGAVTDVQVRWNTAPTTGPPCTPPVSTIDGTGGLLSGLPWSQTVNSAGETQIVEHTGLQVDRYYCYALFAIYPGNIPSPPAFVTATPLPSGSSNPVAWAYSVGFYSSPGPLPTVVPPTVGTDAVYTISNDGVVHAMARGESGGTWPKGSTTPPEDWRPVALGHSASNRSPVVPLPYGSRLFVGTESGEVHAVDGRNGSIAWSRSVRFGNSQLVPQVGGVQATPAGLFTSWGGNNDLILVGTNGTSNNSFYMLNPETGLDRSPAYSDTSMGPIRGMAAVDYPTNRVYFLANSAGGTLWALDLGGIGTPGFSLSTLPPPIPNPVPLAVGANGSPVVRNGRIYFGVGSDLVLYPAPDGYSRSMSLADGEIKAFVFPDRRNTNLYFSTTGTASTKGTVWGFKDTVDSMPSPFTYLWSFDSLTSPAILSPSIVLQRPNTNFIYVGGGDGRLWQIELDPNTWLPTLPLKSVQLEPPGNQIGAPSLDGPNNLVLVGSVSGVVYAVRADPTAGIP